MAGGALRVALSRALRDASAYTGRRARAFGQGADDVARRYDWERELTPLQKNVVPGLFAIPGAMASYQEGGPDDALAGAALPFALWHGLHSVGKRGAMLREGLRAMGEVVPFSGKRFRQERDRMARILRRRGEHELAREMSQARNLEEAARVGLRNTPPDRRNALDAQAWRF